METQGHAWEILLIRWSKVNSSGFYLYSVIKLVSECKFEPEEGYPPFPLYDTLITPLYTHTHTQGRAAYERLFEKGLGDRPGRYYNDKEKGGGGAKCSNCKQRDHTNKNCPWPKVYHYRQ